MRGVVKDCLELFRKFIYFGEGRLPLGSLGPILIILTGRSHTNCSIRQRQSQSPAANPASLTKVLHWNSKFNTANGIAPPMSFHWHHYRFMSIWYACKKCTEHTHLLVVVGKCVCNSRQLDLVCGLTCVYQHGLPAALGAIFSPPCLYNTNTEATQKFKFIISKAYSGSLFMDLFQPIFHAVLHCIPVSCQLGK